MRLMYRLMENGNIYIEQFFNKAISISSNGAPEKTDIDKNGSNKSAIEAFNEDNSISIEKRQCKYLNNIVAQDHRFVKRLIRSMLGFKSF